MKNLLLALSDPMHTHHESAHSWFAEKGQQLLGRLVLSPEIFH